jgi:hypothetical protein
MTPAMLLAVMASRSNTNGFPVTGHLGPIPSRSCNMAPPTVELAAHARESAVGNLQRHDRCPSKEGVA